MYLFNQRQRYILAAIASCLLLLVLIFIRFYQIHAAKQKTAQFCQSVSVGDVIDSVLERAKNAAWIDANAVNGGEDNQEQLPLPQTRNYQDYLNVIFEDRQATPGWPRYLVWDGPLYDRIYCGLEPSDDGKVKAIHLGPIDNETVGFFENWFEDWFEDVLVDFLDQ